MKVLVADSLPQQYIESLEELHCEVLYDQSLKEDSLLDELKRFGPTVLVVRSTKVTGDMLTACPGLSLVIRAGSGYNTIDVKTASERSIYVANCPGKNAIAVAELTMGLILSLDRRIPDNVAARRAGTWNKKEYSKAAGLYGRTLGIIGVGRIGREVIPRARSLGMSVIAWSRSLSPERADVLGIGYCESPLEVAERADVVSVHLALAPETKGLIGKEFFKRMKPGSQFINTSRAEIVDHAALREALETKSIRAGLDVFEEEPAVKAGAFESDIASYPNVYGTHHIGASTEQAQNAVVEEVVYIVREYLITGHVHNCVNLLERTPARYALSVHHRNRVGILAGVLDVIRDANINVETMENIIFEGAEGACARIQIDGNLSPEEVEFIEKSSSDIYSVTQVALDT
jgi:D-3-phosphoglycerate dehydrogenase